jgi:hypothetical protein
MEEADANQDDSMDPGSRTADAAGGPLVLGDHVSLRVEWENIDVDAADDLTFVSAGIDVRF